MKHVWILNHYAQEPGGAGGTRHYSLARHLPSYGWTASIIAASTDHMTGRQRLSDGEQKRVETFGGVPFLWLRTSSYAGNGADRVRNMLDYTRAVLMRDALSSLEPPDVIIGSSIHPLAAWAGRRLAKRYRVPFVFEVRDLWPQTLIDMGRLSSRHPAAMALRHLERSLYRSANRIIVLLPKAHDYIAPLGIAPDKIVWIPNGVDLDQFPLPAPKAPSETFTLMYFGAHGAANGLDNLLQAMKIVEDGAENAPTAPSIALRLIGQGPLKKSLVALAQDLRLKGVTFEAPVRKDEIPLRAAEADAFVICVRQMRNLYRYGISMNKIFDYMAAGRPTIISADVANNPIADSHGGFTVAPENPEALADAILRMAALPPSERAEMGAAARRHLEANYSMERLSARLASTLDACLKAS